MNSCDKAFFARPALELAPLLLGKYLAVRSGGAWRRLRITETEAYLGEGDSACHASRGRTKRTEPLYHGPGTLYVYLCYGIHWLINIAAAEEGVPECVLIRACEAPGDGPGKLTKRLGIDKRFNDTPVYDNPDIRIEDTGDRPEYVVLPRVGIDYAEDADRAAPYRFKLID